MLTTASPTTVLMEASLRPVLMAAPLLEDVLEADLDHQNVMIGPDQPALMDQHQHVRMGQHQSLMMTSQPLSVLTTVSPTTVLMEASPKPVLMAAHPLEASLGQGRGQINQNKMEQNQGKILHHNHGLKKLKRGSRRVSSGVVLLMLPLIVILFLRHHGLILLIQTLLKFVKPLVKMRLRHAFALDLDLVEKLAQSVDRAKQYSYLQASMVYH